MITPIDYYKTKIQVRLTDSSKDFDSRKEMFKWFPWERNGGFGCVVSLSENTPWVIKISWDGEDDGYNKYIDWCFRNQGIPFVPEVYTTFTHNKSGLKYVFMKRYEDRSEELKDIFESYISPIAGSRLQGSCFDSCEDKMDKLNTIRDGFGSFIKKIYTLFGQDYFMDIHYKNIMIDSNNNWIVTDTLAAKRPAKVNKPDVECSKYFSKSGENTSIDVAKEYVKKFVAVNVSWNNLGFVPADIEEVKENFKFKNRLLVVNNCNFKVNNKPIWLKDNRWG